MVMATYQALDDNAGHGDLMHPHESVVGVLKQVATSDLLLPLIDYCELKINLADSNENGDVSSGSTVMSVGGNIVDEGVLCRHLQATMLHSIPSSIPVNVPQHDEYHRQSESAERSVDDKGTVSSKRRRRSVLTLQQKLDVIRRVKAGEKVTRLAAEYGVGKATVSQLRSQEAQIAAFVSKMGNGEGGAAGGVVTARRTMRKPQEERVERALRSWLKIECAKGVPVNGPVLREMAKTYHQKLYGETNNGSSFKASTGWLHRFKRRNGIKVMKHVRMPRSRVESHAEVHAHLNLIREFVRDKGIDADHVYTVDKMQFHFRSLPLSSTASKDCIEVLVCINATGSHRLRLALISDDDQFHNNSVDGVLNVSALPFRRYNAWNSDVFADWFRDEFVATVSTSSDCETTTGALLLVGSACPPGTHGHTATSCTDEGGIRRAVLSSATSFVTQSVNLALFKELLLDYRKSLVSRIVAMHRLHRCAKSQVGQRVSVNDAGYMLTEAWLAISADSVGQMWKDTLQCIGVADTDIVGSVAETVPNSAACSVIEMCAALRQEFAEDVTQERMTGWLLMDVDDVTHVEDIDLHVNGGSNQEGIQEGENGMSASKEHGHGGHSSRNVPSTAEAHLCFIKGLAWLERQPNCDAADLRVLWKLQNMAAAAAAAASVTSNE